MRRRQWALFLAVSLILGCGYRPLGAGPPVVQGAGSAAAGAPTLAIPLFGNRSTEIGLEAIMADALVHAFAQTGAVRVIPGDRAADLVLEGKVRSVDNTSVAYFDVTRSTVRRITVRVDLVLKRGEGGKILWKDTQILQEDYVVDPNYHIAEATKTEGLRRAAVNMARRVMDKVLLVI